MKLRYIDIHPKIIAELPEWTQLEIEHESEESLKDLGIKRGQDESHLEAWGRAMLAENGVEDNPSNRQRLIKAIRHDSGAARFVWCIGSAEREKLGIDDSIAVQRRLAERTAEQVLVYALARAADYGRPYEHETQAARGRSGTSVVRSSGVIWLSVAILAVLVVGWFATAGLFGRLLLLTFVSCWLAALFHSSAREERWPKRLALGFCGAMAIFWFLALLAGMIGAWFVPWNWPWRLLLSLFIAGLVAGSVEQTSTLLRRPYRKRASSSRLETSSLLVPNRPK